MQIRGVTGDMNTGKTYLCNKIQEIGKNKNILVKYISGDDTRRYIVSFSTEDIDKKIQKRLYKAFGKQIMNSDNTIDRSKLGDCIFSDKNNMQRYEIIILPRMRELLTQQIQIFSKYDLLLIEWAALIENNFIDLVENKIILTTCNTKVQLFRSHETDLPVSQIKLRYNYFMPYNIKKTYITRKIISDKRGYYQEFNTSHNPTNNLYKTLLDTLLAKNA